MKKILLTVAAMVIGMSSLFAWTNTIQLGVKGSFPEQIYTTGTRADKFTFNSTGIDIGYIGTFDCGLSLKGNCSAGVGSVKNSYLDNIQDAEFGPYNFNTTESIGVGYSFINTDVLFLGAYGNIGNSNNIAIAASHADDTGFGSCLANSNVFIGAEVAAVYTPVKIFSIYASISANLAFGNLTTASGSLKLTNISRDMDDDERLRPDITECTDFLTKPFLFVKPSIGIAWKF